MGAKGLVLKFFTIAAFGLFSLQASAATVTFNLDYEFSGAQQPQSVTTPWAVATIDDSVGGADTVRLTMEATNLVGAESIGKWFFNFSGDATQLVINSFDTNDATVNAILQDNTGSNNALKADGDGFFDFGFDFSPPGNRFSGGEMMVFDLTYTAPITASDFNLFSAPGGGAGSYLSAAHIQRIADPAFCSDPKDPECGSGWIGAVPVPAAVWLFGSGLLGLVGVARRKRV